MLTTCQMHFEIIAGQTNIHITSLAAGSRDEAKEATLTHVMAIDSGAAKKKNFLEGEQTRPH